MKNIIFDFGGIILTVKMKEIVKKFTDSKEKQEFLLDNVVNSPEWIEYGLIDTGYITKEDFINLVNDRTNNIHKDLVEDFINNYINHVYVDDKIIELIKNLKEQGYKLYLLSNTQKYSYDKFIKDIEYLFDGITLSFKEHLLKPYNAIYERLIEKYNLVPEESLFIDDREDNISTANKYGIKGRKVERNSLEDIKKVLKEYNIGEYYDR